MPSDPVYDLKSVNLPVLKGSSLRLLARILEGPFGGPLARMLLRRAGLERFRCRAFDEAPTWFPLHERSTTQFRGAEHDLSDWPAPTHPEPFATAAAYAAAYRSGSTSPGDVAQAFFAALETDASAVKPVGAFAAVNREDVLRQAEASAARLREGAPRSALEGVPVAVKDELDMVPYATRGGTIFLGQSPARADATTVARLRAAGALLIGKVRMHEIGLGVTGLNVRQGTPRNPFALDHHTGGSSSGSAAAVAAGFCPIALSADGGGSIRVPASFCGVVGLKPTYGRVSEHGALPLCWSVAHVGPIGATTADVALAYAVIAGPDPLDGMSGRQPPHELGDWNNPDLKGLRLGVFRPWFSHAQAEIVTRCERTLAHLQQLGAELREITISDLEVARIAHAITISSEMLEALQIAGPDHRHLHNADVRFTLALSRYYSSGDYVKAQRVRTRMLNLLARVFEQVDVIVTPAAAVTAPAIRPAALQHGECDLATLTEITRFATLANFTGLPAISFPAGYTDKGLPIGMQAIGRPWEERVLLKLSYAAEQGVERRAPQTSYRLLPALFGPKAAEHSVLHAFREI